MWFDLQNIHYMANVYGHSMQLSSGSIDKHRQQVVLKTANVTLASLSSCLINKPGFDGCQKKTIFQTTQSQY